MGEGVAEDPGLQMRHQDVVQVARRPCPLTTHVQASGWSAKLQELNQQHPQKALVWYLDWRGVKANQPK